MRFLRMIGPLVALTFTVGTAPAAASMPIGQVAAAPTGDCGGNFDRAQQTVAAGNGYTVPAATGGITSLSITSWSSTAGVGAPVGAQYTMKVFRQVAGLTYSVVGHDGPHPLAGAGLSTFASNLPVQPGDVLGIHTSTTGTNCTADTGLPGDTLLFRGTSDLPDGSSGAFVLSGDMSRLNIAAVVAPTNTFTLGAIQRNKKKGTATLAVTIPNPGTLALAGNGLKGASGAATSKVVPAAGEVKLLIKAKGQKKRKLNETGKVKVNFEVTYTPTGGDPSAQSTKLKLKKL